MTRECTTHGRVPLARVSFVASGFSDSVGHVQERLERLGTGWLACVFDWEGVLVDDCSAVHTEARARVPVGRPGVPKTECRPVSRRRLLLSRPGSRSPPSSANLRRPRSSCVAQQASRALRHGGLKAIDTCWKGRCSLL